MRTSVFLFVVILACLNVADAETPAPDTLYYNGTIITMDGPKPNFVEAVSVQNNKILAVGKESQVRKACTATTKQVNLNGKTMLPGFIEPHTHLSLSSILGMFGQLQAPPIGNVTTTAGIVDVMKAWVKDNNEFITKVGWIVGCAYDERAYEGHQHPTREQLDQVSTDVPVFALHLSLHSGVVNSKGLQLLGIDEKFVNPPDGAAGRKPNSTIPSGLIEESIFFKAFLGMLQKIPYDMLSHAFEVSEQRYIASGFTTITDGRTDPISLMALVKYADQKRLKLDVVAYIDFLVFSPNNLYKRWTNYTNKYNYTNQLRIGGGKLVVDGSIQASTAWLKEPYYHIPEGQAADYKGYGTYKTTQQLADLMTTLRKNDMQINVHANGDAGIQQFIEAVEQSRKDYNVPTTVPPTGKFNFTNLDNERVVCLHCQYTTEDLTQRMKLNHIIPSYFSAHIIFWGDWHRTQTLGPERAKRLSVAGEAHKNKMLFTAHLDSPVAPPQVMYIISSLVNRKCPSGVVLGQQYRVSTYQALLSVTKYAAFQIFEQNSKGSIEVGKVADFVILSENPLKTKKDKLLDIKVLKTIKGDKDITTNAPKHLQSFHHLRHETDFEHDTQTNIVFPSGWEKNWSFD